MRYFSPLPPPPPPPPPLLLLFFGEGGMATVFRSSSSFDEFIALFAFVWIFVS